MDGVGSTGVPPGTAWCIAEAGFPDQSGRRRTGMKNFEALAYCGLFCGGCKNYKENMNCQGCRNEKSLVDDCPTRACAIKRGLRHCGECDEFPCPVLKEFYEDGVRHHEAAYQNMLRIRSVGADRWLIEQEKIHTCECGRRKLWFADKCDDEAAHGTG
jgi:hypothetical protein